MEKIYITDKLENEISYDSKSVGIALMHPASSSVAQRRIRECLSNSGFIIEFNETKRAYIDTHGTYLEVEFIENEWYVQSIDISKTVSDITDLLKKHDILYINEVIFNAVK